MRSKAVLAVFLGLVVLAVSLLVSCGGGGGSGGAETATVRVAITDHNVGYDAVVLTIEEIGIVASGTQTTYFGRNDVEQLPLTVNVLDFSGAEVLHLADVEVPLPDSGRICFNQIRLVLADEASTDCTGPYCNYVLETGDPTPYPLTTPSGQQSGVKLLTPNDFCAAAGETSVSVVLDFDPTVAIVHHENKPQDFKLKPTGIRIIEGAWEVAPADFISGTVGIPLAAVDGFCPLDFAPVVTIEATSATVPDPVVVTTVSLADSLETNVDLCIAQCAGDPDCETTCAGEPVTDCLYSGPYKLLLATTDTYNLLAGWEDLSASADDVASGSTGVDLLLGSN